MKKNLKNNLKRLISLVICFVFILSSALLNADVFAENTVVDFEESGLELFTYSQNGGVEIKTSNGNKYLCISPGVDGVSAVAAYNFTPVEGTPVELSYDFMINKFMNNDTVIASISENVDQFLRIEVKDGKLAYKNSSGVYVSLLENILANKWYNLKLSIDFDNKIYSVYVDNDCVLTNQNSLASYSYTGKEVKLSFSAKYSPGFSVDNFFITNTKSTSKVAIEGNTDITLADGEEKAFEYNIRALDEDRNEIEGIDFSYIIKPEEGLSATLEGNKLTVNILSTFEGEFTIYIIGGQVVGTKNITVNRYSPVANGLEILGDGKIAFGYNNNTYPFRVKTTDQRGNIIGEYDNVYYYLEGDVPDGLTLDSETGTITVTSEMPKDYHLVLNAVDNDNPAITASKNIVLMDGVTYRQDKEIFDVVLNHIDNIYKYASDTWNGTPLIAQAIDRLTLTPARWYETPDRSFVPSNQASLSQFQRACDVVYLITGEEIYRDRIDESNKFFSENYVNSNGLPYWGGHVYIDMETGKENRDPYYTKNVHELKGHDPYMDSFFRVNPAFAEKVCIACFSQHVKDWNTMDISRHGSYDVATDEGKFYSQVSEYVPSNVGYSPVYTKNLGFADTLYGFARLCIDLYRYNQNEYAANAFMKLFDSYWRVSSPDPDYWLDVPMNTTAGRKGYPDEAVGGLTPITVNDGKWWLLDPVPSYLQSTTYGDRYWRARGDDLIDQGYITEEEQWKARECYIIDEFEYNPQFLYWDFIDTVGEDHPYADIVIERAIRSCANFLRMSYDPEHNNFKIMLIDGTDLTGFVCKRAGYYGGIGQVYNRGSGGTRLFASAALTYVRSLEYPQFKEQSDIIFNFLKIMGESLEMGSLGNKMAGDEGTEVNLACSKATRDHILAMIYLYNGTGNVQFLDLARVIARNYVENYTIDEGFIVENKNYANVFTGGTQSNGLYILTLLEAAIRGEFDKCPVYLEHTGFYEAALYDQNTGEQTLSGQEMAAWQTPMPSIMAQEIELPYRELELKVGETKAIEYTIYPDDAKDKSVYVSSSDTSCVTVDLDSNSIEAIRPGTVTVTVRSNADIMIKDKIKVTVVEQEAESDENQ